MRIVVHDYAGHPFQVQLSRELAGRGHHVLHLYSGSTHTPRGPVEPRDSDPAAFSVDAVTLPEQVAKYSFVRRRRQEVEYGKRLVARVRRFEPDVVLSANTPLDAQARLQRFCAGEGVRFVFWMQDAFGEGVTRVLRRRLPVLGEPVAWHYRRLERRILSASDAIVLITDEFRAAIPPRARTVATVIPNWAPLDDFPVLGKDNDWARAHGLDRTTNLLYAGTLGLKHNPEMLLHLALAVRDDPDVRVVVVSEGPAVDQLRRRARAHGLDGMLFHDFQPFDLLPQVLATGDVLLALLEADAGAYAVPSKVLTYLCAGRAVVAALPPGNQASRTVREAGAGVVVAPDDAEAFVRAAAALAADPVRRREAGLNARAFAERQFDIDRICSRFEDLLLPAMGPGRRGLARPRMPISA